MISTFRSRMAILSVLLSFVAYAHLLAQATFTWTGAVNNNWNNAANWNKSGTSASNWPGEITGQSDAAVVNSGTPTLVAITTTSLTSIQINAPGNVLLNTNVNVNVNGSISGTGTLSQTNGFYLVTGDVSGVTLNLTGGNFHYTGTGTQNIRSGSYITFSKTAASTATLDGPVTASSVSITGGTLALSTFDLTTNTISGTATLDFGGGTLIISGSNTHTGTNTGSPISYHYNGSAGQSIRAISYGNLSFSGAGNKTISGPTTINGTFSVSANIAQNNQPIVANGPVIRTSGSIVSGGNAWTYNSASSQDIIPGTITTLSKNGSGTATLSGNVTATAVSIDNGTLSVGSSSLNASTLAGSGNLDNGSGTITLTGNNSHSGNLIGGTGTFTYNVNAAQTIQGYAATGYFNLTVTNGNTKTLANALKVNNIFTKSGTSTFNIGNQNSSFNHFNLTAGTIAFGSGTTEYSGNFHKTGGTFTGGSGNVTLSSTGFFRSDAALTLTSGSTTVTGAPTFRSVGTVTLNAVSISGTLTNKTNLIVNTSLGGSGTFEQDSIAQLDVNFAGTGPTVANFLVNATGTTVRYTAAGAQTTTSTAYANLTFTNSGTKTISSGTTISNNLNVSAPTVCSFSLTVPGSVSGTSSLTINGSSTLTVNGNYTATGGLTIAGTGGFIANGNVSYGAGALVFNTSTVTIAGTLNGTGSVSFSGSGSLDFTGPGGWTSTSGTFTPSTSTVSYSAGSGSQTVRSTTYFNLSLSGNAIKNYGTGTSGAVANIFSIPAGQTLIYPSGAATLALNGSVTGTGRLLGHPNGTLTVGSPGAVTSSLGTLYFDTSNVMGTINFNRQWNRALQVKIGSSVRLNNYTFLGGFTVGCVEIADNEVFKIESPTVLPTSTLAANVGRLRYFLLSPGSKFVFKPSGTIPAGTNLTFPIGPSPTSVVPWDVLQGLGNGSLNAATIGATTINGTGTNFADQILVGFNLILEDGTVVGEIESYISDTQITLKAPGALVNIPAGSKFRLIQAYRPVTIIPSTSVSGGSLEVTLLNHTGGMVTSGTNVPNVPTNRRTNYIFSIRASGGFPSSAIWTEALLSNDFNATIDDAKYSFFRWNGAFWTKLSADLVGPGAVPSNIQIRRNTVNTMPGVQTFILGQTGGVLPDDPTFSWTGAGGNNLWKNAANWNVFPAGAGPWPDDIGHNVIIDGAGIGGPVIASGDSINVRHIAHSAKKLTIENGGILNIVGNYSFNPPALTAAGIGRLIQNGLNITGTNGSQFTTQLIPGALIYTTEGGFVGSVRSITSNSALLLQGIGGNGTVINIPDSSTYNIIVPTIGAGGGNITASTASNVVTGTGFSSAMNGRVLYVAGNLIVGTVAFVQSPTSLLLVNNSYRNVSNQPFLISSPIVPSGTATTDFQTGSKVNYNSSIADQTIASTSYWWLNMMDNRVNGNTDITRYVNCPGQTITIRGRYRGRVHVKPAASLGPIYQFNHNARFTIIYPINASSTTGGIWDNFSVNGVADAYNIKWGTGPNSRIHYDGWYEDNAFFNFPAMDAKIGNRFGDFSLTNTLSNGRWNLTPGTTLTINGTFTLNNLAGPNAAVLNFGNNIVNPPVSLTLNGPISGIHRMRNNGTPVHQGNLTIAGSGSISGDLFANVSQLRNFTMDRAGETLNLSGTQNLSVAENLTISKGTIGHTGSGTLTVGSNSSTGIFISGTGNLAMSGSSSLQLPTGAGLNLTGGTVNLSNTGAVNISGNWNQSNGTFTRNNLAMTISGHISVTGGGSANLVGSTVTLSGSNVQNLTGTAAGLTFTNLTIDKTGGSATVLGGKIRITGTVSMPASNTANLVTTAGGNLTLVSNTSGTGRIGQILGGVLSGNNFTMERFVNGGTQGWYFLGTPVNGQELGNWADDFNITTPLVCSGTLTDIIDRNTVYRFAGDAVPANGPTPFEVNGWRGPNSCNLSMGEGYRVFLRNNFFQGSRVFANTGSMNFGPTTLPVSYNAGGYNGGGWNLVSNPYPSNIDWDAPTGWTKTNMQGAIYIWNGATNQYGAYVGGFGTNGVDNIIPSNQAFFVRANASPVLQINEAAKTNLTKNLLRTASQAQVFKFKLKTGEAEDEAVIHFSENNNFGFDLHADAAKLWNSTVNLYTLGADEKLSINGLPNLESQTVVPVGIGTAQAGTYSFNFFDWQNLEGSQVWLKDNYLGQLLELNPGQQVAFAVNQDPGSGADSRFELIFVPQSTTSVSNGQRELLEVFPNPTGSEGSVLKTTFRGANLVVTDVLGKEIYRMAVDKNGFAQLAAPVTPGVYHIHVESGSGLRKTVKWIVK